MLLNVVCGLRRGTDLGVVVAVDQQVRRRLEGRLVEAVRLLREECKIHSVDPKLFPASLFSQIVRSVCIYKAANREDATSINKNIYISSTQDAA